MLGSGRLAAAGRRLSADQMSSETATARAPCEFDPLREAFVAGHARPPSLQPADLAALAPLHRALLAIDGTVTTFLEAWFLEPVAVRVLAQETGRLVDGDEWLALPPGSPVIRRAVTLSGAQGGRLYAHAESLIAEAQLPERIRTGLASDRGGLGHILLASGLETRRQGLWWGSETAEIPELTGRCSGRFLTRCYRIFVTGVPVMRVTERFPLELA